MFKYFRLLLLIIGVTTAASSFSQTLVPDGILFQAVARDANGNAAVARAVYVKINILKGSATGTSVYSESFQVTSSDEGIFTIVIGKGTRISGASSLTSVDWSSGIFFMNIQLAVAPTLPDPNWTPTNQYVDLGTSQFWNVPYAFVSGRSAIADSALTIGTIVPSNKGGTGVNNNGKTITIANNIITKGVGDLTITTTANSNVIFPTTGTLATLTGNEILTNKTITSPIINGRPVTITQDTATADSTIATTLYVSKKVSALAAAAGATSGAKLNLADTAAMLLPYAIRSNTIASINAKVNIEDTATMLTPYRLSMIDKDNYKTSNNAVVASLVADTATLITRLGYKINASDTATMLTPYRLSMIDKDNYKTSNNAVVASLVADTATLITRLGYKINASDTAAMLLPYAIRSNTVASINTKVNIEDTATMLTPYRLSMIDKDNYKTSNNAVVASLVADTATLITRLGYKINASDTAAMLLPYAIRSNTVASINTKVNIADTAAMLTARIGRDTISLSNRINALSASSGGNLTAEITRATAAENVLTTNLSAETTRAKAKSTADSVAVYAKIVADSNVLRTLINTANTNIATNLAKEKADSATLVSRISSSEVNITNNTNDIISNLSKERIDSTTLRNLINSNTSTINTNLLKQQTDSLTLANKIRSDSTDLYAKSVSDSTVLRGLINTNINDINTNTTNIANNAMNISTNATNIAANTSAINNRVSFTDMPAFLLPYLKIDDTLNMLANYRAAMIDNNLRIAALVTDTATLITRFSYKENLSNKTTDVTADGTSNVKYPSAKAVKDYVDNAVVAATPDATTGSKGKIQLAGDLTGIAAAPTVNSVGGSSSSTIHTAEILANAATSSNTNNTIVKRDGSGNFSAGVITASLTGNVTGDVTGNLTGDVTGNVAGNLTGNVTGNVTGNLFGNANTTTKLAATKNIYGNPFDGSADLAQAIGGTYGGTGVNNGNKTITLGGNILTANDFTTVGNFNTTLTSTGVTNVTLPTSGTLATLAGTESLTNKVVNGVTLASANTGFTIAGGASSKTLNLINDATISGTNSGDQTIILTGDITGTGTGTFSTTLANSGVTSGVYGGSTSVPTITVDAKGRIISASSTTITGVSSIGSLLESGKIIVGDVSNQAAKVDMSGDVTIDNTGTTTIGANAITTSKISNSNITYAKIQNVSATNKILGRVSAGAGVIEEISTTGTGNVVRAISPAFTGTPTVPTATYPSNDGTIASTQYVTTAINNISASAVSGILPSANGGTGVDNTGKTITLGGNLVTTGTNVSNASAITLKTTGNTVLTLPTSGTLATLSDLSGSSIGGSQITGVINPINGGTGVANSNSNTITLGGSINLGANFTTTGTTGSNSSDITFQTSAPTTITLPTSGTIATLAGTESLTNKTIDASLNTITGITDASIDASANIADSKLATISTAGKVDNAATTATKLNTANAIVARDGNGAFSAGIISASLNGNASSATKLAATKTIYGNAFDGSADLTAVIASSYGGTGNGFTKFTGPTNTEKIFTLPDASATILTTNALVTVAQGGTGAATATQNYIFAGPATGSSAGAPTFRALVAADLPAGSGSYINNSTIQQSSSNFNISGNGVVGGSLTAASLSLTTPLPIASGGIGSSTATQNFIFAGPATGSSSGAPTFRALVAADLPSGSGSYINNSTTQQTTSNFNISGSGVIGTSLSAGTLSLTTALGVSSGGTGLNTITANALLLGNGTSALQTLAPGTTGNVLTSNGTTWTSVPAAVSGVSTVGSISATSNAKGATISGTTITLTPADGTNGGVVTTAAQTFAGTKTFADVNLTGAIIGSSTISSTIAGFNAALSPVTANVTISSANAATYNGKVLVCSGSAFTITFDNTIPTGFSCMILQSDNNIVSFSGASNRYNYSQTSGLYAIATALCYASGSILLTGDLQ
jgi:hypothetical protein